MPGLYPPFAQRPFSDDDEVGRVAQRDLCDRVGFDDLQDPWKAPYHVTRACLEIISRLGGTL